MIELTDIEEYFPEVNKIIKISKFEFLVTLNQDEKEETFVINLKISQEDNKEEHLTKFRFGMGKDKPKIGSVHSPEIPHFEIDVYKRKEKSFDTTIYFTFNKIEDEDILNYAKGTVFLINKILENFFNKNKLDIGKIQEIIYTDAVTKELEEFEEILINALKESFENNELILRQKGEQIVIKTLQNLKKYLDQDELKPLYLPLKKKIEKK